MKELLQLDRLNNEELKQTLIDTELHIEEPLKSMIKKAVKEILENKGVILSILLLASLLIYLGYEAPREVVKTLIDFNFR